ncbi:MAG TPA: cytochrome b/b6 domain-containing protein [Ideonella sp.]|uniref:cytochrome b/b6 domain-containing protein n=1 Tax=Ideonella sp. TaxID=1929293 RepID=UPI002E2FA18A|nr:cytochrome b/b6 domain-containing protein [Ideonella sp.]HEX5685102.1 cytochrome b/b6 domain-containing protein [Ideonella sp.]
MKTASVSPADAASSRPGRRLPLIWDAPVRVFHWLAVLSFAGAYLTAESERWRLVHVTLGYTLAGLVAFRVVWGFIGTRHARFASFVRGPAAAVAYLRALLAGKSAPHPGHNPAGALAIVALLALAAGVTATGWLTYAEWGGDRFEDMHEALANLMLGLVGVHVAAVVISSRLYRDNLVRAMFTGRKAAPPYEGIHRAWHGLAVLMLATVLGFWWLQWLDAPPPGASDRSHASERAGHDEEDDDD